MVAGGALLVMCICAGGVFFSIVHNSNSNSDGKAALDEEEAQAQAQAQGAETEGDGAVRNPEKRAVAVVGDDDEPPVDAGSLLEADGSFIGAAVSGDGAPAQGNADDDDDDDGDEEEEEGAGVGLLPVPRP